MVSIVTRKGMARGLWCHREKSFKDVIKMTRRATGAKETLTEFIKESLSME